MVKADAKAHPMDATDQSGVGQKGVKEELKASLDAPPGSLFHHAQGYLVVLTLKRKPSLLCEFLYKIV